MINARFTPQPSIFGDNQWSVIYILYTSATTDQRDVMTLRPLTSAVAVGVRTARAGFLSRRTSKACACSWVSPGSVWFSLTI